MAGMSARASWTLALLLALAAFASWSARGEDVPPAAGSPAPLEAELDASYDHLTRHHADWWSSSFTLDQSFENRSSWYATFKESNRYSLDDQDLLAGGAIPLSKRWSVLLDASVSPSHNVSPKWFGQGRLRWDLPKGWDLKFGAGHSDYDAGDNNNQVFTLENSTGDWHTGYTYARDHSEGVGGSSHTHTFNVDYRYGHRSSIGLGYTTGVSALRVGKRAEPVYPHTTEYALNGRQEFGSRSPWSLYYRFSWGEEEEQFTRTGVELGLAYRF